MYSGQFDTDRAIYSIISRHLLNEKHQPFRKPLDLLDIGFNEVVKHYKEVVTLANSMFIIHGDINLNHFV